MEGDADDIKRILSVLGSEGMLDTLLALRELEPATASELASHMDIHVATAVKRLSALHEIGLLDRRTRKGKTRSAREYELMSRSFGLDIDLDQLAGERPGDELAVYPALVSDMADRFARFSGKHRSDIISGWKAMLDFPDGFFTGGEDYTVEDALDIISGIIEAESVEYGRLTARSVAEASVESVATTEEFRQYLIERLIK